VAFFASPPVVDGDSQPSSLDTTVSIKNGIYSCYMFGFRDYDIFVIGLFLSAKVSSVTKSSSVFRSKHLEYVLSVIKIKKHNVNNCFFIL
jgi:hypothetical protein